MKTTTVLAGIAVVWMSSPALANPMLMDLTSAQQVPGTAHVQVTWRHIDDNAASSFEISRDGSAIQTTPAESKPGGSEDMGSGTRSLYALVTCDCNVPVGQHGYTLLGDSRDLTYGVPIVVDVVEASACTAAIGGPTTDCAAQCTAVGSAAGGAGGAAATDDAGGAGDPVASGGALVAEGTPSTASDADPESNDQKDSTGCAVSRTHDGLAASGIFGVFGLLALAFWRRK